MSIASPVRATTKSDQVEVLVRHAEAECRSVGDATAAPSTLLAGVGQSLYHA